MTSQVRMSSCGAQGYISKRPGKPFWKPVGPIPSQSEMRVEDFDNNILFIQRVTFSIGAFFCDRMTYIVTMTDNTYLDAKSLIPSEISPPEALPDYPCTREEFLDRLSELHLGEWRNHYNPERFGYAVLDGTQWKLVIEFFQWAQVLQGAWQQCLPV